MNHIRQIIAYIRKAQEIAAQHGFKNLLQPGLVKELIIADLLGHEVHRVTGHFKTSQWWSLQNQPP